jgi:hypothetical protein
MAALPTSSFRAPAEHHALVHAIAKALRRRPDLAEPLRLLLAQVADTAEGAAAPLPSLADLVRRLDAVEQRVAEHGALLATRELQPAVVNTQMGALPALQPALQAPPEPWTVGEGKQKRLTAAGLDELDRRLRAGDTCAAAAAALGVSAQTASKRRAAAGTAT